MLKKLRKWLKRLMKGETPMISYVADFETLKEKDGSTRIWAWGFSEIGNVENFQHGTTMESFIEWCYKGDNKIVYFHNLKFDGEFIFHWLLSNGFQYSTEKLSKTFNCIVSSQGQFYEIEIIFETKNKKYRKVTIYDSYKKLPFTVKKIGKDFKLPIQKVDEPQEFYERYRPIGHDLTDEELFYLKMDVQVVAMALGIQFEQELVKMTIGGDALSSFKKTLGGGDKKKGEKEFKRYFPVLPQIIDMDIRQSYKGGFTYVKEGIAGCDIAEGIVFDVNSLYPSVMYQKELPYGLPFFYKGEYVPDEQYPLYIQRIRCSFTLKPNHIPTIQIKHGGRFVATEYLKSSRDKLGNSIIDLVLTSVDLELFLEHYIVEDLEYISGWKFKSFTGFFKEYIDYWTEIKIANSKEKNALYQLAKLMLNNLYGKFATNPDITGKYPVLNEDGSISYKLRDEELRDPVYTAMGSFITAYAREKTIRSCQANYDRFLYADTDSKHLMGTTIPDNMDIHDNRLGAWAHESTFTKARFLRAKTYVEDIDGKLHVTCAGMPDNVKELVTWENFHVGLSLHGKLVPKHVNGGIILEPTDFTIS